MAVLKQRLHRKNSSGSYDTIYLETSSEVVVRPDGTTVEAALTELKTSVSNGKSAVASAITDKGVSTSATAEFATMASNIRAIPQLDTSDATATAAQILAGSTAYVKGSKITGSMTNRGAVSQTLNCGGSYTIPAGYHNGSGKVTGNSLASQTDATATAAQILTGQSAWVKGAKLTGSMANQGAKSTSLNCGGSYTIPAGYHNGSGKVTANSLASQTSATAAASDIASGKTAWVNGSRITGTMVSTCVSSSFKPTSLLSSVVLPISNKNNFLIIGDGWCTDFKGFIYCVIIINNNVTVYCVGTGSLNLNNDSTFTYTPATNTVTSNSQYAKFVQQNYLCYGW